MVESITSQGGYQLNIEPKYYNKLDIGILLKNYNLFWLSEDNVISITLT